MIENRAVGIKSRELYEAPAAIALIEAHRALEDLVLTKAELHAKRELEPTLGEARLRGPLVHARARGVRRVLRDDAGARHRRGAAVARRPGAPVVTGRRSEHALYAETLASYATGETFPHEAAEGFIRIAALETELRRRAAARARSRHDALVGPRRRRELDAGGLGRSSQADDAELLPYDCEATLVHARRLHAAGLLDDDGARRGRGARSAALEWRAASDEDVHTLIERQLGEVGRKIHAGRSRNDQVAAAFRLYVADACAEARGGDRGASPRPSSTAPRTEAETPMPGYTHLQRAQPVTVGHHLLAWVEMLERDRARFRFAAEQARAVAARRGRARRLDARAAAAPGPDVRNSLDAVADRDFALDYLYAVRRALRAPLADRRGARALGDAPSSASRGCPRRRRPARR